uniref:hypothetical protein n=1 Tax=Edwardsiella tarda TaxID=636 RepID=UPI00402AF5C2
MDCSTPPDLLSLQQALERLLSAAQPISESEDVALGEAVGRISAQPIVSPLNVPPSPIRRWMVMPYVWPTCTALSHCLSPARPSRANRSRGVAGA